MTDTNRRRMIGVVAGVLISMTAVPLASAPPPRQPRADLADRVQGSYVGDVVSDARGSSRTGVGVVVTKVGINRVSVTFDYDRMPARTFHLTRVMSTIQNVGGTEVFLYELAKSPSRLSLTIDDAAWSGTRAE